MPHKKRPGTVPAQDNSIFEIQNLIEMNEPKKDHRTTLDLPVELVVGPHSHCGQLTQEDLRHERQGDEFDQRTQTKEFMRR